MNKKKIKFVSQENELNLSPSILQTPNSKKEDFQLINSKTNKLDLFQSSSDWKENLNKTTN